MFRSNPGVTGVAFTDKHPYFDTIPEKAKKDIFIAAERLMPKRVSTKPTPAQKQAIYKKQFNKQFDLIEKYSRGSLHKHKLYKPTDDHTDLISYGEYKAISGSDVRLLPDVHHDDTTGREVLQAGAKGSHNTDLWINGEWWELESPTKKETIKGRISKGFSQCDNVVVFMKQDISKHDAFHIAINRFKNFKHLKQLAFKIPLEDEWYFDRSVLMLE